LNLPDVLAQEQDWLSTLDVEIDEESNRQTPVFLPSPPLLPDFVTQRVNDALADARRQKDRYTSDAMSMASKKRQRATCADRKKKIRKIVNNDPGDLNSIGEEEDFEVQNNGDLIGKEMESCVELREMRRKDSDDVEETVNAKHRKGVSHDEDLIDRVGTKERPKKKPIDDVNKNFGMEENSKRCGSKDDEAKSEPVFKEPSRIGIFKGNHAPKKTMAVDISLDSIKNQRTDSSKKPLQSTMDKLMKFKNTTPSRQPTKVSTPINPTLSSAVPAVPSTSTDSPPSLLNTPVATSTQVPITCHLSLTSQQPLCSSQDQETDLFSSQQSVEDVNRTRFSKSQVPIDKEKLKSLCRLGKALSQSQSQTLFSQSDADRVASQFSLHEDDMSWDNLDLEL